MKDMLSAFSAAQPSVILSMSMQGFVWRIISKLPNAVSVLAQCEQERL